MEAYIKDNIEVNTFKLLSLDKINMIIHHKEWHNKYYWKSMPLLDYVSEELLGVFDKPEKKKSLLHPTPGLSK